MGWTTPASIGSCQESTASADQAEPVVELVDAHKKFGSIEALKGVTLAVRPGELVGLLGPNGAGKTTAISLMLGLRRPTSGEALLFGRHPQDIRARTRAGVMLQDSGVPLTLKVREIIDLFRSYYPSPLPTPAVIAAAGVEEFAERLVRDLSGGQRQRVYFALAICGDPELLFLDEPTVGLDTASRRSFWEQLRRFKQRGRAVVLTTHYLDEAEAIADRVVVIDQGRVLAEDSPEAIRSRVPGRKVSFVSSDASPAHFQGLPVENLLVEGGRVEFLTSDPEAVLRRLFADGRQITQLEVVGSGLEEAVLVLTHGR